MIEENTLGGAVEYWCEQTGNEVGGREAAEAREMVEGRTDVGAENFLITAADLYDGRPGALSRDLDEFSYLHIVLALSENKLFEEDAANLAEHLEGTYATHADAARAALDFFSDVEYAPKIADRDRLTEDDIEEIRVFAMNTAPGIDMIELGDGTWLLYNHHG